MRRSVIMNLCHDHMIHNHYNYELPRLEICYIYLVTFGTNENMKLCPFNNILQIGTMSSTLLLYTHNIPEVVAICYRPIYKTILMM